MNKGVSSLSHWKLVAAFADPFTEVETSALRENFSNSTVSKTYQMEGYLCGGHY